ncbi:MAG: helix-turn-helix transcriptional regulator, partial [Bacilli bacterium]|nr:helix-turn-helix transcriptional regulator [Bacilli bacterium]
MRLLITLQFVFFTNNANNYAMDYGRRFRNYREKKKLTQKEAAELLGITPYQL